MIPSTTKTWDFKTQVAKQQPTSVCTRMHVYAQTHTPAHTMMTTDK